MNDREERTYEVPVEATVVRKYTVIATSEQAAQDIAEDYARDEWGHGVFLEALDPRPLTQSEVEDFYDDAA